MSSLNLITYAKLFRVLVPDQYQDGTSRSGRYSHSVAITALDSASLNLDLFVYQIETFTNNVGTTTKTAFFSNVASTYDLQEIPAGIPSASYNGTMFRHHTVTALTRSLEEAEYLWDEIQRDVAELVAHHKKLNQSEGTYEVVVIS